MRVVFALYVICEDIKIHALSNIMPTKGDIMREGRKYNLTINLRKKIFHNNYVQTSSKFIPKINLIAGGIFGGLALKKGIHAALLAVSLITFLLILPLFVKYLNLFGLIKF